MKKLRLEEVKLMKDNSARVVMVGEEQGNEGEVDLNVKQVVRGDYPVHEDFKNALQSMVGSLGELIDMGKKDVSKVKVMKVRLKHDGFDGVKSIVIGAQKVLKDGRLWNFETPEKVIEEMSASGAGKVYELLGVVEEEAFEYALSKKRTVVQMEMEFDIVDQVDALVEEGDLIPAESA